MYKYSEQEKSKCIVVSTCKHYVCNWIFHSSFFTLHLNMLLANSVSDNYYNYFNYLKTKQEVIGQFWRKLKIKN